MKENDQPQKGHASIEALLSSMAAIATEIDAVFEREAEALSSTSRYKFRLAKALALEVVDQLQQLSAERKDGTDTPPAEGTDTPQERTAA
jgi:hypothetical protein